MAKNETDYQADAQSDAGNMVREFVEQIAEQLVENGTASNDYNNDYPDGDSYHHERHVDKDYSLTEAANLLDQLYRFEETDSGLWQGLEPRRAIVCQAAYTYGNAVSAAWFALIKSINEDDDIAEILSDHQERANHDEEDDGPLPEPCLPAWVQAILAGELQGQLPQASVALRVAMGPTERAMLRDACEEAGKPYLARLVTDGTVAADLEQRILAIVEES